jgi:hypothetical protein
VSDSTPHEIFENRLKGLVTFAMAYWDLIQPGDEYEENWPTSEYVARLLVGSTEDYMSIILHFKRIPLGVVRDKRQIDSFFRRHIFDALPRGEEICKKQNKSK